MSSSGRRFVYLLPAALLAGCECGVPVLLDAGTDAGMPSCGAEHPTIACVPGGSFELPKYWWYGEQQLPPPIDPSPVAEAHLPTFWIDRREVTVERYAAAVEAGVVPPPPERCGVRFVTGVDPEFGPSSVEEVSGWTGTEPDPARLDHPVVCVTREEAQAYCESVGGRLPRAAEMMKAARGTDPGPRRFPWGNEPPSPGSDRSLMLHSGPDGWWLEYATIGVWRGEADPALGTRNGGGLAGASPFGVLELSGNVSEHLFDCAVDITTVYGGLSSDPLVVPASGWRADCPPNSDRGEAYLLAGTNWASAPVTESLSMSVVRRLPLPERVERINVGVVPANAVSSLRFAETFWGAGEAPLDFDDVPSERERRSWFVGFRCAYDEAP